MAVDGTLTLIRRGDQWSPAMIHKDTSLLSYFSLTKRRVQGGVATSERRRRDGVYQKSSKDFPSLENLPASSHFASCKQPSPSGANTLPRPSRYSIATVTGSKRPRADSDLPLCHVRLRRTSRELTDSRKRTRSASPRQGGLILGACLGANIVRWGLFRQYTVVTPHPSR